jgi:hypothetical protein
VDKKMANRTKLAGLVVALGLMSLASTTASAGPISFSFHNEGYINDVTSCGGNCFRLATTGTATEIGGLPGANSWTFNGVMEFNGLFDNSGDGTGAGLGWWFTDNAGTNNLFGSFNSSINGLVGLLGGGQVNYSIAGGSGLFAGATGFGVSQIDYFLGLFSEYGRMFVTTPNTTPPTTVAEPGMAGVLAAGMGMFGFLAWRSRRTRQPEK